MKDGLLIKVLISTLTQGKLMMAEKFLQQNCI